MKTEELRESVKQVVAESIKGKLEEATAQRLSIFEAEQEEDVNDVPDDDKNEDGVDDDEAVTENDKECDDDKKKVAFGSDDDDDEDEDVGLDESIQSIYDAVLVEALKVVAMPTSERSKGTKGKAEDIEVKDLRELTKLAKTGKYDYFTVTKKDGDEDEYHVSKGKLVLM